MGRFKAQVVASGRNWHSACRRWNWGLSFQEEGSAASGMRHLRSLQNMKAYYDGKYQDKLFVSHFCVGLKMEIHQQFVRH